MNNFSFKVLTLISLFVMLLSSCTGRRAGIDDSSSNIIGEARLLILSDHDGYSVARIKNPWDTLAAPAEYYLVERGRDVEVPHGAVKIEVPVERAVVFSSVHTTLLSELGCMENVAGVCDAQYIADPAIKDRIKKGLVADCGLISSPNREKIIGSLPGMILMSAFQNGSVASQMRQTGTPVVEGAEYMENTPLARAEWMRFYGRLFGKGNEADARFEKLRSNYNSMSAKAKGAGHRPSVMYDMIYNGIWCQPTPESTTGRMIEDAGGSVLFHGNGQGGNVQLSPEKVLKEGKDADVWMVRHFGGGPLTLGKIAADNPIYTKFKAFKEGNVYGSDTQRSMVFEDASFHPDRILADMIRVLHPEIEIDSSYPHYYQRIDDFL